MGKFQAALGEGLSLYVRHFAWLNTAVEPVTGAKNGGRIDGVVRERKSRLERLREEAKDDDYLPDMPPVDCEYLLVYLFEAGPLQGGGSAPAALGWTEISAWRSLAGVALAPWQARLLRRLSLDYLNQMLQSTDPDCAPPWGAATVGKQLAAADMKAHMKMLKDL